MDEIMAALEGDPTVQFIEIVVSDNGQKDWGPQGAETESRAMLVFFDAAGNQTAVFKFPNDPPAGGNTVLIATAAFTARTGLRADITMPPLLNAGSGKVCFRGNPANPSSFAVNLCLSYGDFPPGLTEGAGPPAPALPGSGQPTSLARFQNLGFGDSTSRNADFILGSPSPVNTSGQTINFPVPGPEISVSPALVSFGNRDVAQGPAAPRTITITSLGSSNPLVIANVTLSGPNADQFRILSDSGQTVLGPSSNRLVTLDFDPTTVGAKSASLRIASNDSDEPTAEVVLQGGGIDSNPCAAPDPLVAVAQDNCALAQLIAPAIAYSGNFLDANSDGFSSCIQPGSVDVWFRYVATSNGILTVSAAASLGQGVGLSAHSGCPGTSANQLACIPSLGSVMQQRFQLNVIAGAEILLRLTRIGGEGQPGAGQPGPPVTFQLLLAGPPPFDFDKNRNGVNDTCEFDFGDAPAPYPTSLAANGARHRALTSLFLGRHIDPNTNGLPSASATGDNIDGPANDDDGIIWETALIPGLPARVRALASSNGFLNAWIDFNADGDWSDAGEQVFGDRSLVTGSNGLLFFVPPSAVVTNQTFARFRLNSTGGLGFIGGATDGEVEDYAVPISASSSVAAFAGGTISEVMAGLNGDSSIQFVELVVGSAQSSRNWGPQAGGTNGRAMLVFFDAAGRQTGRFVFPSNAPASGSNVLVATRAFAQATGLTPDFIMPPELMAIAGKVAFRPNPDNPFFTGDTPFSYGGAGYFGSTDGAGPANTASLPILGATSLQRDSSQQLTIQRNDIYRPGAPTPQNAAGQTVSLTAAPLVEQGRTLFDKETFNGNGRTCFSCHRSGHDQFGLTPATIAALPDSDPLFVFEQNVNILRLASRSQPSDLRGRITGSSGEAEILAGSGDTYLVLGGGQLSGVIADTNGNSGAHRDFTLGDLEGPTASNGSGHGLEDHEMLRHGRGLVLENIDGFTKREVFRTSPHLLNIAQTAPYGLSGEFANLRDFSAGAVAQHAPRSMARVSGTDFREPTPEELVAMEVFMNSIVTPSRGDLSLDRFVTTEAQKRGRALFFGNEAKCSKCHSGPTLAFSDGSLPGTLADVNENFDTGVANLAMNGPTGSNLPTEPAGLARSTRKFNTPPLFGIRLTAPFFHDGSATNLRAAVEFYDEADFATSPSGPMTGSMPAVNDPAKAADLVAFLESLVEIPIEFTRQATFGIRCGSAAGRVSIGVTNVGTNSLAITNVAFVGLNSGDFRIAQDSGESTLGPGQARRLEVEFSPASQGSKQATLEFAATDPDIPGAIRFATAVSGAQVDNVVRAGPTALGFAARGIAEPPSAAQFVRVTNTGSGPLEFVRISFVGANPGDFRIVTDSDPTNLVAGGVRTLGIAFAPQGRGARSALLRIESIACSGAVIDLALNGTATSTLDHFEWAPIAPTQGFNSTFQVTLSAVDRNGELIAGFNGAVSLSAISGSNPTNLAASTILITELDPGGTDAIEFMNVSTGPVDLSGWQVQIIDQVQVTTPLTFTFPPDSIAPPGSLFRLGEGSLGPPGVFPNFFGQFNISWVGAFSNLAVQIRNPQGNVVDFATGSSAGAGVFFFPTVPATEWSGPGFATPALDSITSYQRVGFADNNNASDWVIAPVSMGVINSGLASTFATPPRVVSLSLSNTTAFIGGVWSGQLAVRTEAVDVRLFADDGAGHIGTSGPFSVVGSPPTITSIPNQTVAEDSLSSLVTFNVNDAETPATALSVTATSSNAVLVPASGIFLSGSSNLRTIRVQPATNQFGTADITVRVSDGSSSAERTFNLAVQSVNDAPVVLPVGSRVVTERTSVSINVLAIDPDLPNDTLTFSLVQGAVGATIESTTGLIQWFPTEQQGGTTFNFIVSVRDAAFAPASTTNFLVQVLKVNNPPTLDPVPPQSVFAGGLLRFTNTALDLDIPTNFLTFSFATNVPGASIHPASGVVTWMPLISQVGLNVLFPVVRDNFQPQLSATQAVTVTVLRPPMDFTTNVDFGINCVGGPPVEPRTIGITNTGATSLTLLTAQFSGTNLAEFPVLSDTEETTLAPGAVRRIEVGFVPQGFGRKAAAFNLSATAGAALGSFSFSVPLTGAFVDSSVAVNVTAIDFGTRSIDVDQQLPPPLPRLIAITNVGLGPLQIDAVTFSVTNSLEFILISDSNETVVPPGGTRQWQFTFTPQSRGPKSARLIIDSLACSGGHIEIPLTGVGTSPVDHFAWDTFSPTQSVGVPFPVRLTAQDRNNQTVTEFAGPAALEAFVGLQTLPPRIVITEIDPGTPDAVEFVNVSGTAQSLTNWQVFLYDDISSGNPVASVTLSGVVPSNGVFTVTEMGPTPGLFPNFFAGANVFWTERSTNVSVLLIDNLFNIVDFATTGDRARIVNPIQIQTNQWSSGGIPVGATEDVLSYNRVGFSDRNSLSDWVLDTRGIGVRHAGLRPPFTTNRFLESFPAATGAFTNGFWAGSVGILEEASQVRLRASDNSGHATASALFTVRGTPPFLSDLADLTLAEDTVTPVIQFSVSDAEQASGTLVVTAVSSNGVVVPDFGIILGGSGDIRNLRIVPLTNASGVTLITVNVSDATQTTSKSFRVTVTPSPDPPFISNIGLRQVNELQPFILTVPAFDPDPGTRLAFSLLTAPAGASIHPTNGNITWTPTEAQGPTNAFFIVQVADDGFPSLVVTQGFGVTVFEVNQPPVIQPISNRVVHVGNVLTLTNVVVDPDIPTNTHFFSLIQAPPGANVDSFGGRFSYAPFPSHVGSNFLVRVRAIDSGNPSLSATQSFTIAVLPLPISQPAPVDFGNNCLEAFPLPTQTVNFRNQSAISVNVTSLVLAGASAEEFVIASDTGESLILPGQSRSLNLGFNPLNAGSWNAVLVLAGQQQQASFSVSVQLTGTLLDSMAVAAPSALNFGTRDIDQGFSGTQFFTVTNVGSVILSSVRVRFSTGDTNDFQVTSDTGQPNLFPGGTRTIGVAFRPTRRGSRAATVVVESAACLNAALEIALAGNGVSGLHHFTWDPVSSPTTPGSSVAVRVRAVDRNDEPVPDFIGTVSLSAFGTTDLLPVKPVLITEIDIGTEAVEFMNVSGRPLDLSGWRVLLYEAPVTPIASVTIPVGSILGSNSLFAVTEGTTSNSWPSLFAGTLVNWQPNSTNLSVVLLDAAGGVVDFATLGSSAAILNPVDIPVSHWRGEGIPLGATEFATSYQRRGYNERNDSSDWVVAPRSFGIANAGLASVFLSANTNTIVRIAPTNSTAFVAGEWAGAVSAFDETRAVRVRADDGAGHVGVSPPFDVFDQPPSISDIADRTIDEDSGVVTVTFNVGDDHTSVSNLIVFASSSNTNFLSDSHIVLLGSGALRGVRLSPATNQAGSAIITVFVSDGAQTSSTSFLFTVRPVNDPPVMQLGSGFAEGFRENFDNVTRPALPPGWTSASTAGIQWQTVNTSFDTAPNSVFLPDPSFTTDNSLTSPSMLLGPSPTNLTFRHSFSTESCCDGGFLEVSVNNSSFSNVTRLGWTFTTGPYNSFDSWRGSSGGFITTTLALPPNLANQTLRFRWRFTSDSSVPGPGWFIDSIAAGSTSSTNRLANEDVPIAISVPVSDAETPAAALSLTVASSNPTLVPPSSVLFGGTDATRIVTVVPATNQSGSADLRLVLSDGELTATQFVTVTFLPVNDPPSFVPVPDQLVDEGTTLEVRLTATDPDLGTNRLTFSPVFMPSGASIDQVTGVITWIPTEFQGPGFSSFSIMVSDNTIPPLSSSHTFIVFVREVNSAPELTPMGSTTVYPGVPISRRFLAFDSDVPANSLRFSLVSPPSGVSIDPFSGQFNWTPGVAHIGTNQINVQVTDDGLPPMSGTVPLTVRVLAGPEIQSISVTAGSVVLLWHSLTGLKYRVQFSDQLPAVNWTNIPGDVTASSALSTKVDATPSPAKRFYRILFVP